MICQHCNSNIPDDTNFCPMCGQPVLLSQQPQSYPIYHAQQTNYGRPYNSVPMTTIPMKTKKKKSGLIIGLSIVGAVIIAGVVVLVLWLCGVFGGGNHQSPVINGNLEWEESSAVNANSVSNEQLGLESSVESNTESSIEFLAEEDGCATPKQVAERFMEAAVHSDGQSILDLITNKAMALYVAREGCDNEEQLAAEVALDLSDLTNSTYTIGEPEAVSEKKLSDLQDYYRQLISVTAAQSIIVTATLSSGETVQITIIAIQIDGGNGWYLDFDHISSSYVD